jgi:hypothetical protein
MSDPSLLNIPYRFKASKLYSQIPDSGLGDFVVSRSASNVATRVNAQGFIETVADNVPRLDYPLGGIANGCPALLVEPPATNLALQSENFGTNWIPVALLAFGSGSVLNTTATLDPYGTNLADFIVANAVLDQHRVDQTTVSAAGSYTFSVFLKAGGYGFGRLRIGSIGATFNLTTGALSSTDTGIVSSIQSYGNGWYRCIISKAASIANEIVRVNILQSGSGDFAGNGTSGIYIFGSQYELGAAASSYIPTTTQAITRSNEIMTKTSISSLIGQSEGSIYWDIAAVGGVLTGTGNPELGVRNEAFTNWIGLTSNAPSFPFRISATATGLGSLINYQANITSGKAALAWSSAGLVLYVNGVSVATSATNPNFSFSRADIRGATMPFKANAFALYPTRLTDTQLQALTT